jgi:DNA-binding MurR/RpiR family transcriptional regulator
MQQRFKAHSLFRTTDAGTRTVPMEGQEAADAIARALVERGITELERLRRNLDGVAFRAAVELRRDAPQPCVTTQHLAHPMAPLFAWSLNRHGRQCPMLDNTGGYALPQSTLLRPGDRLVATSLALYQPSAVQAAQAHAERGGKVLAITDTALSPLAPHATVLIELPCLEAGSTTPLTGLTCVVQALADASMSTA